MELVSNLYDIEANIYLLLLCKDAQAKVQLDKCKD